MERSKTIKMLSTIYLVFGLFLFFVAFATLAISFYPQIWYSIDKEATNSELNTLTKDIEEIDASEKEEENAEVLALPPLDTSLPEDNMIVISSIGINSVIVENNSADAGLKDGIWRVPNFGTPALDNLPIIIAAHRFGYIEWTTEFRESSTFYNLPKLKVGDRVQIIWEQRSYEYEVVKSEDNTQITDYNSDLILYTCRMYNSPVRVFRYLDRVK